MTTETLNISEEQLVDYSKAHNEPSWMTELRKKALKLTETLEMPKPDKTKLRKAHKSEAGKIVQALRAIWITRNKSLIQ